MRKHSFIAALTAAVTALSSAALPSAAYAASKQGTYSYDPEYSETIELHEEVYKEAGQFTLDINDPDLVNAIKESTGDDFFEESLRITKASITYTVTGEGDDIGVYAVCSGMGADGEWTDVNENGPWYEAKSGTISTDDEQFAKCGLDNYGFIGIAATGRGIGDLTLDVTGVELEVSYAANENIPVTGTEKYTFGDDRLSYDISQNPIFTVGYEPFEEDYYIAYWLEWSPDAFEGISTIEDFVSKYGSLEMKFRAEDIQGDAEVYAMIEVGDESKGESQQIFLPAQDITKGQNVYSVDFDGNIKAEYSAFRSVSVHFRSKTRGETAKFMLGLYDSSFVAATGTEIFKSGFDYDEALTISVEMPEWWNPENGSLYIGATGIWYYGMGEGVNTCLANTIPELYSTYKGGELTFNISNLSTDVTYDVRLQTRVEDEYGEEIIISANNKLQNGLNTVKFDLPKIMYVNPDIWGISMYFDADKATEFTISKAESSSDDFKTEDKPIEDIMEEVKPDTTASIEVAAADTAIKADIFEAAKEKNITLELKLENGVKWEIKAETIGDGAADVNINVGLNTSNVPAASVDAVAEGKSTMQISLAHNGSFGFKANITIPVAPANNGKVANLFHFNNGTLEFVASVTVSNGEAILPFSHASEYVIVFDEKSMGASGSTSDTSSVPETSTNPGTGAAGFGGCAALAAVSAAAVIICRKNKHN